MNAPNSKLWQNYESFGRARGRMVAHLLSQQIDLSRSSILDFGCGEGAVALELAAAGAHVVALDENNEKISKLRTIVHQTRAKVKIVDHMPAEKECFDAVVLVDVIEHLNCPEAVLKSVHNALKPGGIIYLSTPSKLSPANILCDPHFSLPIVSLLNRQQVRFVLADLLHWQPRDRMDFPQLFRLESLWKLLLAGGFQPCLINSAAAKYAFQHPQSIWNRDSHLKIIRFMKRIGGTNVVERYLSDTPDFFNCWINPAWYLIAKKKSRC
jgi:2-polyprenyl-3-methyl-5-hydroxy-6-metoxy-1,4-benzoquinol methylase